MVGKIKLRYYSKMKWISWMWETKNEMIMQVQCLLCFHLAGVKNLTFWFLPSCRPLFLPGNGKCIFGRRSGTEERKNGGLPQHN